MLAWTHSLGLRTENATTSLSLRATILTLVNPKIASKSVIRYRFGVAFSSTAIGYNTVLT